MTSHADLEEIFEGSPVHDSNNSNNIMVGRSQDNLHSMMESQATLRHTGDDRDTSSIEGSTSSESFPYGGMQGPHRRVGFKPEDDDYLYDEKPPENEIEARKMYNNHLFGFRKWKSHVTDRPISTRSEIIQSLYTDVNEPVEVSTLRVSNVLYSIFIGWWVSLIYVILGCLLFLSFVGQRYAYLCFKLAGYFIWPFGKFVYQVHHRSLGNGSPAGSDYHNYSAIDNLTTSNNECSKRGTQCPHAVIFSGESISLLKDSCEEKNAKDHKGNGDKSCWEKVQMCFWLVFAVPILLIVHGVVFGICWFFIITIPIAKINSKTMKTILFIDPDEIRIGYSSLSSPAGGHKEIIVFTYQSFNWYYYKYTLDGVNIIFANLLIFVLISIVLGYVDADNVVVSPVVKCILSILAIIPVTYYIGMAITSISAQSSFAVGAILNATFGSIVEVILFIIMLYKGKQQGELCFEELVKSTLTGSIICCILLVPGLSMVVGGLKYRQQHFNPKSANISSSLLFVAIVGVFAPTIFAKIYGNLECGKCEPYIMDDSKQNKTGFLCSMCKTVMVGPGHDETLYNTHVKPLVYACAIILPVSYVIGLIFSMKTHNADIFEEFEKKQKEEGKGGHHHGIASWSRLKSTIILLLSVTAISLCADLISVNIPPLLNVSGLSEYFVGVTLLSIVSMLPEILNGVQFALQNNVNLSIEIGSAAAIQVCMVQLPIIIFANIVYPMGFTAVFNDIHLWVIVFAVIIINYIFQDGKSDYFQGSIIMFIYILLMLMYFFTVTPEQAICKAN